MRMNAKFEGVAAKHGESVASGRGDQLKHLSPLIGKGDSGLSGVSSNVEKQLAQALGEKYALVNTPVAVRTRRKLFWFSNSPTPGLRDGRSLG